MPRKKATRKMQPQKPTMDKSGNSWGIDQAKYDAARVPKPKRE